MSNPSQSKHDKSGHARSVGATIRRQQTIRFTELTHEILFEWRDDIEQCHRIFLFAPGDNKLNFFMSSDEYNKWLTTGGNQLLASPPAQQYGPLWDSSSELLPTPSSPSSSSPTSSSSVSLFVNPSSPLCLLEPRVGPAVRASAHPQWKQATILHTYLYLLRRDDPRVRGIPISVRAPKFGEVERVKKELSGAVIANITQASNTSNSTTNNTSTNSSAERNNRTDYLTPQVSIIPLPSPNNTTGDDGNNTSSSNRTSMPSVPLLTTTDLYYKYLRPLISLACCAKTQKERMSLLNDIADVYQNALINDDDDDEEDETDNRDEGKTSTDKSLANIELYNNLLVTTKVFLQRKLGALPSALTRSAASLPLFVATTVMIMKEGASLTAIANEGTITIDEDPSNEAKDGDDNSSPLPESADPSSSSSSSLSSSPSSASLESVPANFPALLSFITSHFPEDINTLLPDTQRSLLHWACSEKAGFAIISALLDAGCDPRLEDVHGKTASGLAKTQATKMALRRYAGTHSNMYDWEEECEIVPYNEDAEKRKLEAQMEKERAKRKVEKEKAKQRKEKEKANLEAGEKAKALAAQKKAEEAKRFAEQKRIEAEVRKAEVEREAKYKSMSEREKRADAATRRMMLMKSMAGGEAMEACAMCSRPLLEVPFERLTYKYCTTACLRAHKTKLGE